MPVFIADELLNRIIEEDLPYSDLTTEILDIGNKRGKILFSTREPTVICCTEEVTRIFQKFGAETKHALPSGEYLPAGVDFLEVDGSAKALHAGWRISLSILEHVSGIATRTRKIVEAAKEMNPNISVETSRKSFPGGKNCHSRRFCAAVRIPIDSAYPSPFLFSSTIVYFWKTSKISGRRSSRSNRRCQAKKSLWRSRMKKRQLSQ